MPANPYRVTSNNFFGLLGTAPNPAAAFLAGFTAYKADEQEQRTLNSELQSQAVLRQYRQQLTRANKQAQELTELKTEQAILKIDEERARRDLITLATTNVRDSGLAGSPQQINAEALRLASVSGNPLLAGVEIGLAEAIRTDQIEDVEGFNTTRAGIINNAIKLGSLGIALAEDPKAQLLERQRLERENPSLLSVYDEGLRINAALREKLKLQESRNEAAIAGQTNPPVPSGLPPQGQRTPRQFNPADQQASGLPPAPTAGQAVGNVRNQALTPRADAATIARPAPGATTIGDRFSRGFWNYYGTTPEEAGKFFDNILPGFPTDEGDERALQQLRDNPIGIGRESGDEIPPVSFIEDQIPQGFEGNAILGALGGGISTLDGGIDPQQFGESLQQLLGRFT